MPEALQVEVQDGVGKTLLFAALNDHSLEL